jgi:hypothetical protein
MSDVRRTEVERTNDEKFSGSLGTGKGRNLFRVRAAIAKLESDIKATPIVAPSTE